MLARERELGLAEIEAALAGTDFAAARQEARRCASLSGSRDVLV